jgi:hypothetical protein
MKGSKKETTGRVCLLCGAGEWHKNDECDYFEDHE